MIVLKKTTPVAGEYPVHGYFIPTSSDSHPMPKTFFGSRLKKALAGDTPLSAAFEAAVEPLAKLNP